jgi:hypothetical protein
MRVRNYYSVLITHKILMTTARKGAIKSQMPKIPDEISSLNGTEWRH